MSISPPAPTQPTAPRSRPRRSPVRPLAAGAVALVAFLCAPVAPATAAPDDDGSHHDAEAGLSSVTECVIVNGDGTFTAFFGYDNRTGGPVRRPLGEANRVRGAEGAAPTNFAAGRHVAVFSATSTGSRITWRLGDRDAVATPRSVPCSTNPSMPEAPVTLVLLLAPTFVTGWWIRRRQRLLSCATASRPC